MNLYYTSKERELISAAKKGDEKKTKLLLTDISLDVQFYDPATSRTALMLACQYDHVSVVRLLAAYDTERHINLQDKPIGKTALMIACELGHVEVVKVLLEHRARVKLKQRTGCTALILAARYGHTDIIRLIIKKSDIDAQNRNGSTALMAAITGGSFVAFYVVQLLLEGNANVNEVDHASRTALNLAVKCNQTDIIQLLKDKGALMEVKNEEREGIAQEKKDAQDTFHKQSTHSTIIHTHASTRPGMTSRISSLFGLRRRKQSDPMDDVQRSLGSRRNIDLLHSRSLIGLDERNTQRRTGGDLTNNIVHFEVPFGKPIEDVYDGVHDGRILGTGISGTVRLCKHKSTGVQYAVKCLDLDQIESDEGLTQLRMEIGIMCQLDHPNIIRIEEVYESYKDIYLVLELCTGGELFDRLDEQPDCHYSEATCARLVKQMLDAIRYIHSKGIIHRDLKLENFLFIDGSPDSELKLIDFGLSKHFKFGDMHHEAVGTPYTVAPEVLKGCYDERCDMWAIGVITFLLLSGESPFGGFSGPDPLGALRQNILQGFYSFQPREIWTFVSDEAKSFIRWLLVTDPKRRRTAAECQKSNWILNWATKHQPKDKSLNPDVLEALLLFKEYSLMRKLFCGVLSFTLLPNQITTLRKDFHKLDVDGNGDISLTELKKVLLGALKESDLEDLFRAIRVRNSTSNSINWHDFLAAGISSVADLDDRNYKLAFNRLDSDHTGYITFDNIMDLLGKDGLGKENELQAMWDEIVFALKARDSRITYDEFVVLMKTTDWKDIPREVESFTRTGDSSIQESIEKIKLHIKPPYDEIPADIRGAAISSIQCKSQSSTSSETTATELSNFSSTHSNDNLSLSGFVALE